MLPTLLLLALITAAENDPQPAAVPDNFRLYFERADASRAAAIQLAEQRIEEQEVEYRGAPPARKAPLRRAINLDKSQLEANKKRQAIADLPSRPQPGDLGHLTDVEVLAVLDDERIVAKILAQPMGKPNVSTHAVLKLESTKGIRVNAKQGYHPANVWLVLDEKPTDDPLAAKWLPESAKKQPDKLLVLKAVPNAELEKHRANWKSTSH